jgi:hypothetical protein
MFDDSSATGITVEEELFMDDSSYATNVTVKNGAKLYTHSNSHATNIRVDKGGLLIIIERACCIATVNENTSLHIRDSSQLLLLQLDFPKDLIAFESYRLAVLGKGITREKITQAANEKKFKPKKITLNPNQLTTFNVEARRYIVIPIRVRRSYLEDTSGYAVVRVDDKGNLWLEGIYTIEEIGDNNKITLKNGKEIVLTV